MKSSEIRTRFYNFFTKRNHEKVSSSSLIPAQDPTLLFANAGMNQFKDVFLGDEARSYSRAVTIQKCMRAGGKHNDLDNVGFTKRHLTFFEMMGNFSFGDYFKKEGIRFAWDFLTVEMQLPKDKLHISIYKTDDEAYAIWHEEIGVPSNMIHRLGEKENFWQMGDTGPCGPCTEMHLDRGPGYGCEDAASCGPACDCDRFLEIWNVVFMQYDRQADGSMKELERKGVDTGMGLERLAAVMQNQTSVFGTDLCSGIIKKIEQLTGQNYEQQTDGLKAAFHVLADHIRASTFLIADGCAPSNEGRGYVLRKIIRRAALFQQKITSKDIFPALSEVVIADMSPFYPELKNQAETILVVLHSETKKFAASLLRGQGVLERFFIESAEDKIITGLQAFKLYDTYGFPIELVIIMAREKGYTVNEQEFESHMLQQKTKSGKKVEDPLDLIDLSPEVTTEFTGYQELETVSDIVAIIVDGKEVSSVDSGVTCWLLTRKSPFFIVGGGQVPDEGWLMINNTKQKVPIKTAGHIAGRIALECSLPIKVKVGDIVTLIVDKMWRTNAMKNHTATHLLQAALIELFGNHIKQSGSLVHPDYLRFDFTYHENLSAFDIRRVEQLVNEKIRENIPVTIEYTSMRDAVQRGALAFFGDKYNPEDVRMVQVDTFSVELCGGTHVPATGVIGAFKIIEVTALSAGHRRIVAVTGPRALELFQETFELVRDLSHQFKVPREKVLSAVETLSVQTRDLQKQVKELKRAVWNTRIPLLEKEIKEISGVPFLCAYFNSFIMDDLREIAQSLVKKRPGFYLLVSTASTAGVTSGSTANNHDQQIFFATLSPEFLFNLDLKKFGAWLDKTHGLKGGGSAQMLQGGGKLISHGSLVESVSDWMRTFVTKADNTAS